MLFNREKGKLTFPMGFPFLVYGGRTNKKEMFLEHLFLCNIME